MGGFDQSAITHLNHLIWSYIRRAYDRTAVMSSLAHAGSPCVTCGRLSPHSLVAPIPFKKSGEKNPARAPVDRPDPIRRCRFRWRRTDRLHGKATLTDRRAGVYSVSSFRAWEKDLTLTNSVFFTIRSIFESISLRLSKSPVSFDSLPDRPP